MVAPTPRGVIGYTCSYTPVELIWAAGYRPYRLLHGHPEQMREADRWLRVDACPIARSNLGHLLRHQDDFAAVVGSTGCDMARRLLEVVAEVTGLPVYVLNCPRTDNSLMYREEVAWLWEELHHLAGTALRQHHIAAAVQAWDLARSRYLRLDLMRRGDPSVLSTSVLHEAAVHYHQGDVEYDPSPEQEASHAPRVYLIGSPVPYEGGAVLRHLEESLRIVGDFNCGVSRFLNLRIKEPTLDGVTRAYYEQPPCICRRPNAPFYEYVAGRLAQLRCIGVVAWTLDYCDSYEFELRRMERVLGLPVLRLRSDLSFENKAQLDTRIQAFGELLCATT